jgi:hypothetical protein
MPCCSRVHGAGFGRADSVVGAGAAADSVAGTDPAEDPTAWSGAAVVGAAPVSPSVVAGPSSDATWHIC